MLPNQDRLNRSEQEPFDPKVLLDLLPATSFDLVMEANARWGFERDYTLNLLSQLRRNRMIVKTDGVYVPRIEK